MPPTPAEQARQDFENHLAGCPICQKAASQHEACATGRQLHEQMVLAEIAAHHDRQGLTRPPELQAALSAPKPPPRANHRVYQLPPAPMIPVAAQIIEGTDHSVWQGSNGDFNALKAGGYWFALVKATEGLGYTDPTFVGNLHKLLASGLIVGVYHFSRPDLGSSPADEARWFVEQVVAVAGGVRGLLFEHDAESAGGSEAWCREFKDGLRTVIAEHGVADYAGGFYSYLNWIQSRGIGTGSSLGQEHLWLAWPDANGALPHPPPWPFVSIQQYTARPVPGWSGNVDVNRFFGTSDQLRALAAGASGGFLMALTDQEQRDLYNRVLEIHPIWDWVTSNGDPLLRDVQAKVAEVHAIWAYVTQQGDPQVKLLQKEIVDLLTKVGQLATGSGGVVHLDDATKTELDAITAAVQDVHTHFNSVFK